MASHLSSFNIIADSENIIPDEPTKRILKRERSQVTRRAALSTINENIHVTRAPNEQSTFLKPGTTSCSYTNVCVKPLAIRPTKTAFAIFEDKPPTKTASQLEESEPLITLSENVTSVYKPDFLIAEPISPKVDAENEDQDSLMQLDSSCESTGAISHVDNLFISSIYFKDIYSYLKEAEKKFRPKPMYMRKQPDITQAMRSILVDWLVEVTEEYKMQTETLYLAVSYIDRFLSTMSVVRNKLQLVGTACMFLAAKYEEIYPPELKEFVYITDDTYTKKQVLRMEQLILKVLGFDLAVPTAYDFLLRMCCITQTPENVQNLAQYICELSLLEAEPFLGFLPSEIASASLFLANYTLGYEPWSDHLKSITEYTVENFSTCLHCLFKRYSNVSGYPQKAIYEKYKSSRFHGVAMITSPTEIIC